MNGLLLKKTNALNLPIKQLGEIQNRDLTRTPWLNEGSFSTQSSSRVEDYKTINRDLQVYCCCFSFARLQNVSFYTSSCLRDGETSVNFIRFLTYYALCNNFYNPHFLRLLCWHAKLPRLNCQCIAKTLLLVPFLPFCNFKIYGSTPNVHKKNKFKT